MAFLVKALSRWYVQRLGDRLGAMGLTYHDAMAETGVYEQAVERLPADLQEQRSRRLKRASDLSMKHVEIPKHMQEDPFREFKVVQDVLSETQAEKDERKSVAKHWWMPYHIGRETWHSYDTSKAWWWKSVSGAPLPAKRQLK